MSVRLLLSLSGMLLASSAFVAGCSSDDTATNPAAEFIAANTDFAGYERWARVAGPIIGPDPGGMEGNAHLGDSLNRQREVFMNNSTTVRGANGQFPNGTIFAKRISDTLGNALFTIAMAKRGGSFNAKHNGWEWFVIDQGTGAIMQRGDSLAGGCNGCHEFAGASKDYVFTR